MHSADSNFALFVGSMRGRQQRQYQSVQADFPLHLVPRIHSQGNQKAQTSKLHSHNCELLPMDKGYPKLYVAGYPFWIVALV